MSFKNIQIRLFPGEIEFMRNYFNDIYKKCMEISFMSIFLFSFILFVPAIAQQPVGKITVQVNGFSSDDGKARLLLFSSAEKEFYPQDKDKCLRKHIVSIKNNKVLFTFDNLPYGDYAVSVHHDEDNNGKVNTNILGIPNEGLGASNDAKGFIGPPSFEKAKVSLNKEQINITINLVD